MICPVSTVKRAMPQIPAAAPRRIISASRRTDIPAFYMPWFMAGIERGVFEVVNPFNRRVRRVAAAVDRVHSIVFWSKDFGPFIRGGYGERLEDAGYHLFFNFTVNSEVPALEPRVPPLSRRLEQLEILCRRYDPRAVAWRFDPICFFRISGGAVADNTEDFERIARRAADCGVRRCITSFVDDYAKVRRRADRLPGFAFVQPDTGRKHALLQHMQGVCAALRMKLETCCEKTLLDTLSPGSGIRPSACIPAALIMEIYGGRLSLKRDAGQRVKQGCGCRESIDIGSYDLHPCYHNCLFCYANPRSPAEAG